MKDIAQSMITLRDASAFQAKVIEFNGALIDAQTKIFAVNEERTALVESVRSLEKEIADLKAWKREKERYQLNQVPPGIFVYALKPEMAGGEPPHQICECCYQQGKKFLLHKSEPINGLYQLKCNGCRTELRAGNFIAPRGF